MLSHQLPYFASLLVACQIPGYLLIHQAHPDPSNVGVDCRNGLFSTAATRLLLLVAATDFG